MTDNPEEACARAEAKFAKAQKIAHESKTARTEYEAAARAAREKTVRLRSLRLAKEVAEMKAGSKKKPATPRKKPSR